MNIIEELYNTVANVVNCVATPPGQLSDLETMMLSVRTQVPFVTIYKLLQIIKCYWIGIGLEDWEPEYNLYTKSFKVASQGKIELAYHTVAKTYMPMRQSKDP